MPPGPRRKGRRTNERTANRPSWRSASSAQRKGECGAGRLVVGAVEAHATCGAGATSTIRRPSSWKSEDDLDELGTHHAAAVQGLIPFGPHQGQRVQLFGDPPEAAPPRPFKKLCADHDGYSLHAAVRVGAGNPNRLERIARYVTRPALAQDRLALARDGSIVYRFKKPWRNGKQAVVMDPLTFISCLAALIPPPRFHTLP